MKKTGFFLLSLLACAVSGQAKVVLPDQISSHMVLQQQTDAKLWGWTDAGKTVKVTVSWNQDNYVTKADKTGRWELFVKTPTASFDAQTLTISDGEPVALEDVLIGEVWLASGQSNMQMPLRGFWNCPVEESAQTIALSAQYANRIRFASIEQQHCYTPADKAKGTWKVCTPVNAANFGATAFYFAENLTRILNVPVGIINNAWGGSMIEGWFPAEILKEYGEAYTKEDILKEPQDYHRREIMYNGVHHPIVGYTIKGCIWYQGESNVGRHATVPERMARLISLWRSEWKQGDFPFYMVEIAPYEYGYDPQGALLREAQHKVCDLTVNTGIISTSDLVYPYEVNQIHPAQKEKVGQRLSYLALTETYKMEGIPTYSPKYKSMEIQGEKVRLTFDHITDAFNSVDEMQGFEICGADRKFVPAKAKAENQQIVVYSDEVKEPVAVRYNFHNFCVGTVKGANGMPLIPFRTDNF